MQNEIKGTFIEIYNLKEREDRMKEEKGFDMGNGELTKCNAAIRRYQKAIDIDPNDAEAYNNMGRSSHDLKNYHEAIRYCQKAIEINSKFAAAYYHMGYTYQVLKNYHEALRCYKKTVNFNPYSIIVYYNETGNECYDLKNYKAAIHYYKKVMDNVPVFLMILATCHNMKDVYSNMEDAYSELADYGKLVRYLQEGEIIYSIHTNAYYNMGNAYGKLGNKQKQIEYYKKAAQLGHEDAQSWLRENGYNW
jgi:superkiller protein 3